LPYEDNKRGYDGEKNKEPSFLLNNHPSKVIFVKSISNNSITVNMLYNLFSNYGNISRLLHLK